MAEHVWSVLCNRSVVDKDTRQVSLFNVCEAFKVRLLEPFHGKLGMIPFHTEVVTLWTRTDPEQEEETTCKCEMVTPGGSVHPSELRLDLTSSRRFRSTFQADVFPV